MTKIYHLQLDIRGCLLNWKDRNFVGVFRADDSRVLSPREAKAELLDHLAQGHRLYPCSSECEGFDWQTGCPGHAQADDCSEDEEK